MKNFILFASLGFLLTACGSGSPGPAPIAAQPPLKWTAQQLDTKSQGCGQYYCSINGGQTSQWIAACRCLYTAGAAKWTMDEYFANPQDEQSLIDAGVGKTCMQQAGIPVGQSF